MMNSAEAEITPYQNHLRIEDHKVRIAKLEEFSHEADKNISQLIINQKSQNRELTKISAQLQKLLEKDLKAEGAKDLLRKIWSLKSLFVFLLLLMVAICTHNPNVQALLTKILGF